MKCHLCEKPIQNYHPALHHLTIDDSHGVDICQNCIDTFLKWQGRVFANLFPTRALKKRFGQS